MSEPRALNITSLVTKKTRRAKARLMQNLGKAGKTTDELFDVYELNFKRQQNTALSLQHHVKHYLQCLKDMHEASKNLSKCLLEMHEKDWPKHDVYENNAYEMDHVNEDLEEKIKESVVVPVEQYISQFAEVRDKIAKRGRKLVDYDSLKYSYESMQQAARQDDSKLSKHREHLDEARKVYDSLNNELHDDLPALYENRVPFIITIFQRLFQSKLSYHQDNSTIQKSYLDTIEILAKATEKGALNFIKPSEYHTPAIKYPPLASSSSSNVYTDAKSQSSNGTNADTDSNTRGRDSANNVNSACLTSVAQSGKPPVYLHKVCATYKYMAEDEDELSFEAGDIIQVIEYDDPDDQEEGWLKGIKETDGEKGLFPANFTKPL